MTRTIKIGTMCPTSGPLPEKVGIGNMARILEEAGFEALWTRDHTILPANLTTPRNDPFVEGGFWGSSNPSSYTSNPWFDAVVSMAIMAAATKEVDIGVSCLVLPYRDPIVTAKQLAAVDVESGGRLNGLALCVGWLTQEFQFLGIPFEERGTRLDEGIVVMRSCWKGEVEPFEGKHYQLPTGALAYPAPNRDVPILIAGNSTRAFKRVVQLSTAGWNPVRRADALMPETIAESVKKMQAFAREAGEAEPSFRVVLRISVSSTATETIAQAWPALVEAGVTEVIVDTDWDSGNHADVYNQLLSVDEAI